MNVPVVGSPNEDVEKTRRIFWVPISYETLWAMPNFLHGLLDLQLVRKT